MCSTPINPSQLLLLLALCSQGNKQLVSQATPFAERGIKGLVTLQLPSCHQGTQLLNLEVR